MSPGTSPGSKRRQTSPLNEEVEHEQIASSAKYNRRKRKSSNCNGDDTDSEEQQDDREEDLDEKEEYSSSEDDDDDSDADFGATLAAKKKAPAKSVSSASKSRGSASKTSKPTKGKQSKLSPMPPMTQGRRAISNALTILSKKVLHEEETRESSLVAALLNSHKVEGRRTKTRLGPGESIYTARLESVAGLVIEEHANDPNKAEASLFNLLFRSVGGGFSTNIDPQEVDLENLSDDDWGAIIQDIVDEMSATPADCVLLCADFHGASGGNKTPLGISEYRKIYEEFWYRLARVSLTETNSPTTASVKSDSDDDSSVGENSPHIQVDTSREIMARLIEMIAVGVHDIRSAATMAVYQMGVAMLDVSVELKTKLQVATRQLNVAKESRMKRKAELLKGRVSAWERAVSDLEGIVKETVMGVFMKRYRDVNTYIRAYSLKAMSQFTLIRPDIFLTGFYLKYFGWMLSDKEAHVRETAIGSLLAPFHEAERRRSRRDSITINTSSMEMVLEKFLPRLADCVIDVDVQVQEVAMELLLTMLRASLLDTLETDHTIWDQINFRALAPDTSPAVRRLALYFVIDQIEAFDRETSNASESNDLGKINALVTWIAHTLSDASGMPIENIRYDLTDYVVSSLRTMSEHLSLVCNWSAMLRGLDHEAMREAEEDNEKKKSERRVEAVKKRVLLRMLVCAAEMEVMEVADASFMSTVLDPDLVEAMAIEKKQTTGRRPAKKKKATPSHEELTLALLGALPSLLQTFKTMTAELQSLTQLPQFFLPSVFNLSSRKKDFQQLSSGLCGVLIESTDPTVISNCCLAMTSLAKGEHARNDDALLRLKETARTTRDRLLNLLGERQDSDAMEEDDDEYASPANKVHSISLCMRRLGAFSKRWNIAELLLDNPDAGSADEETAKLFGAIVKYMAQELKARRMIEPGEDNAPSEIPEIWKNEDGKIHGFVAGALSEALPLLLTMLAWRLNQEIERIDNNETQSDEDDENHLLLRMRRDLLNLILLCFEQHISPEDALSVSQEHKKFAVAVQKPAGRILGDLRSLLPKQWSLSKSRLLAALSLVDDGRLVGGFVQFVVSQQEKLFVDGASETQDSSAIENLLRPWARGITANWKLGNRKEAGAALAHSIGCGNDVSSLLSSMSKVLKKMGPVRLLEAHMSCLSGKFEDWINSEPGELESDRPTEQEMADFEQAEKRHNARFESIEQYAAKFSASLGVGKLSKALSQAVCEFVVEGVRIAFDTEDHGFEDLPVGTRLPFLRIMSKYLTWIRNDKTHKETLEKYFNNKEADLRNHPDFRDIFEDDIKTLVQFRRAANFGEFLVEDDQTADEDDGDDDDGPTATTTSAPGSQHTVTSVDVQHRTTPSGSSVSTIRSRSLSRSYLSPLQEGDGESPDKAREDDDGATRGPGSVGDSNSKAKVKPADASVEGSINSLSSLGRPETIKEGKESSDSDN